MIDRIFKSEEMYLKILESIGDAVIVTKVNGDIFFMNGIAEKLSKWSKNEALGKPIESIFNIINEHTREPVENPSRKVLKEGHVAGLAHHTILIGRDGTEIPIDDSGAIVKDKDGRILGTVLIFRDITERKKAEDELRLHSQIMTNMYDAVNLVRENDGIIVYTNPRFDEIFGYNPGELIGKQVSILNAPTSISPEEMVEEVIKIMKEKGAWQGEIKNIKKDGTLFWCHVKVTFFKHLEYGKVWVAVQTDITERKKAEQKLRESEENYRRAYNRAEFYKDLFAHDINNILQSILTAADINLMKLRNLEDSKDLLEVNHSIKEQVNRGAKLVSNIRKLSIIEEQEIKLQPINFIKMLKKSINFIKKSYKHKQIEIQVNQEEDLPNINANDFLEDVFENILINAVKYTQNLKKEILVKISKEKKTELDYVKIEFIDNGIGIPDLIKEKIFNRSYNEGRSVGGMGLGLSLVKKIVETYKGHIWVENKIKDDHSKGSNFVLLLPEGGF